MTPQPTSSPQAPASHQALSPADKPLLPCVYTLTLNPSLDYHLSVDELSAGALLRTTNEYLEAGGKGLNVSRMLTRLGVPTQAITVCAGATGKLLCELLAQEELPLHAIALSPNSPNSPNAHSAPSTSAEGQTRINVKIDRPQETQLNGRGPKLSSHELTAISQHLATLPAGSYLVLAGSYAPGVPQGTYAKLAHDAACRGLHVVVDAEGSELMSALAFRPYLIKPNAHELAQLVNNPITTPTEALIGAQKLQALGAQNVVVSLGGAGAILLTQTGTAFHTYAPAHQVQSTIAAGDSLVAGLIYGQITQSPAANSTACAANTAPGADKPMPLTPEALVWGVCAGSATAYTQGLASFEAIVDLTAVVRANLRQL